MFIQVIPVKLYIWVAFMLLFCSMLLSEDLIGK